MLAGINRALTGRRRPARHANVLRAGASLAVVSWLAACATPPAANTATQGPPALTPQQEAADYLAHARARYLPPGPPSDPWGPYVVEASRRFDVPETWIREVMQVESAGYQFRATGELTVSPAGAMGLMQLMPETYDEMRGRYNLGPDAYEPHDNILAGSAYLREMYDAFGAPAFLAAYNAGPARLQDYLVHNKPLPDETRRYVWTIGNRIIGVWPQNRSPAEQLAVNHIPLDIPAGPRWVRHTTRLAARDRRRHEAAVRYAALHTHGRAHAHDTAPVEVAMAPEPGPARVAAVTPTPAVHRGGSLHLITPALAADHVKLGGNHWAVQVGAYANRQQAEHAAGAARGMVSHASPAVAAVHTGHATLYRARLGGLTHDGAVAACHRMSHCLVVSPASQ
jgi:hypothetical protein